MKISSHRCSIKEYREYWDHQVERIPPFFDAPTTRYYFEGEKRLFRNYFGDIKGKKLLKIDLWNETNNTQIMLWAIKQGADAYGLDISNLIVKRAKENMEDKDVQPKVLVSDVREMPFKSETFDFIYTMGTIEHFVDTTVAVCEIHRILKKNGVAIVGVPNKHDPFLRPLLVSLLNLLNLYPYGYEKSFSHKDLKNLFPANKFKTIGQDGLLFMPGILRIFDIFFSIYLPPVTLITSFFNKAFEFLSRMFPKLNAHGYLISIIVKKC